MIQKTFGAPEKRIIASHLQSSTSAYLKMRGLPFLLQACPSTEVGKEKVKNSFILAKDSWLSQSKNSTEAQVHIRPKGQEQFRQWLQDELL